MRYLLLSLLFLIGTSSAWASLPHAPDSLFWPKGWVPQAPAASAPDLLHAHKHPYRYHQAILRQRIRMILNGHQKLVRQCLEAYEPGKLLRPPSSCSQLQHYTASAASMQTEKGNTILADYLLTIEHWSLSCELGHPSCLSKSTLRAMDHPPHTRS